MSCDPKAFLCLLLRMDKVRMAGFTSWATINSLCMTLQAPRDHSIQQYYPKYSKSCIKCCSSRDPQPGSTTTRNRKAIAAHPRTRMLSSEITRPSLTSRILETCAFSRQTLTLTAELSCFGVAWQYLFPFLSVWPWAFISGEFKV